MSSERQRTVIVRLDSVEDLFADPGTSGASARYISGIEELYRAIKVHTRVFKRPDTYRVTIELPGEQITDGDVDAIRERIRRYCQFHADQCQQDLLVLRHQGLDSIRVGVLVLIPCLILGVICTWLSQTGLNGVLQAIFLVVAAVFILSAGWVALWMPAEFFLYDPWPYQQDSRVYQQIAEADLVISTYREDAPPSAVTDEAVSAPQGDRHVASA